MLLSRSGAMGNTGTETRAGHGAVLFLAERLWDHGDRVQDRPLTTAGGLGSTISCRGAMANTVMGSRAGL